MARSVRLRAWQKRALDKLLNHDRPDFLAVATPGAGKTTFALTAARHHLAEFPHARVIVVVPTQHLKMQWASAAANFDLHLEPEWSAAGGRLPADMHGVITTYQQVAGCAGLLAALSLDAFVVFDEIHHAGDDRAWGDGVASAFADAGRRLSLSGTPFRSDTRAIPFVQYEWEEAQPDFEYGYGHALSDGGVVRPIHFPRIDGQMEWTAPDGTFHSHGFEDELDAARTGQRLRTALSMEGQWLTSVLVRAHEHLMQLRQQHANAGGLVIAMDQEHARAIAEFLEKRLRTKVVVATSDDPMASRRIARYAAGTDPWIVAVRMVSEGVDIPRLRVGVFATNTVTELFFRQAIGRLVRYTREVGGRQSAYLYLPDDPRLRTSAAQVAHQRRHSLHKRAQERDFPEDSNESELLGKDEERISQFSVISAVAHDEPDDYEDSDSEEDSTYELTDDDESLVIDLAPAPPLAGGGANGGVGTKSRSELKSELRTANSEKVRELVQLTGLSYAAVNKELNQRAGVAKVTEATTVALERRLRNAEMWLTKLTTAG
jgi:superfamily II DNA or RNA helicase